MKIREMPEQNRPRERFASFGPSSLSDAELMAIILRTGSKTENVIDMSNRLIKEHGLNKIFDCSLEELQEVNGIGPSKAMQILAMAELGKRHSLSKNKLKRITSAKDVFNLFHERLRNEKQEHFYIITLSTKNHVLGDHLISKGVLDAAILEPREVFRPAVKVAASRIIIIHNHPSGDPAPSDEDIEVTKKLIQAGEMMNIKVLDHVIVGNGKMWSWADDWKG
ncbi:MAG: DNA repair protein RadC [Nanoarchaeota archaeon]